MKKYFILLISFLFLSQLPGFLPVYARPANPDLLPKVEPLFPPPAGVIPNYQGTINNSSEFSTSSAPNEQDQTGQPISPGAEPGPDTQNSEGLIDEQNGSRFTLWLILGLAVVFAFVYYVFAKSKGEQ